MIATLWAEEYLHTTILDLRRVRVCFNPRARTSPRLNNETFLWHSKFNQVRTGDLGTTPGQTLVSRLRSSVVRTAHKAKFAG